MSSSLFRASPPASQQQVQTVQPMSNKELHGAIRNMRGMLKGKDKRKVLTQLCMKDPNINSFVQQAQGKSIDQVAMECGVDLSFLRSIK